MSRGTFSTSNYLTTGVAPSVTAYPFSLSCWIKSTVTNKTQYAFGFVYSLGLYDHAIVGLRSTGVAFYYLRRSSNNIFNSTTLYSANVWNHILAVSNSATDHRIYLNGGGKNTSATNTPFPNMNTTTIGLLNRSAPTGGAAWSIIGECAAWNVALDDADAAALAAGYSPLLIHPHLLRNYIPCGALLVPASTGNEPDVISGVAEVETGTVGYSDDHPPIIHARRPQRFQ